jgi:hypothetical protein
VALPFTDWFYTGGIDYLTMYDEKCCERWSFCAHAEIWKYHGFSPSIFSIVAQQAQTNCVYLAHIFTGEIAKLDLGDFRNAGCLSAHNSSMTLKNNDQLVVVRFV